jgi:hypothetical protein
VDITENAREEAEDGSSLRIEPFIDFEFQTIREWIWVVRISKNIKNSALLICGCLHALSVSEKFRWVGFEVETHVYIDPQDDKMIKGAS